MAVNKPAKKPKKRGGNRPGAGRPPLPPDQARTERIALRLTRDELRRIEAKAAGQPVSEWVREQVLAN